MGMGEELDAGAGPQAEFNLVSRVSVKLVQMESHFPILDFIDDVVGPTVLLGVGVLQVAAQIIC